MSYRCLCIITLPQLSMDAGLPHPLSKSTAKLFSQQVHSSCVRACVRVYEWEREKTSCGSRGGGRYTVRDVVWGSHSEPVSFPAASIHHSDKEREDTIQSRHLWQFTK